MSPNSQAEGCACTACLQVVPYYQYLPPGGGRSGVRVYKDLPLLLLLLFLLLILISSHPAIPSHPIPAHLISSHAIPHPITSHSIPSHPTPFPFPLRDPVPKNKQLFGSFFGPARVRISYTPLLRRGLFCNVEKVCAKGPVPYVGCGLLRALLASRFRVGGGSSRGGRPKHMLKSQS